MIKSTLLYQNIHTAILKAKKFVMTPSLVIGGIPFYDAPSEVDGSPYWIDLWTDVNVYKMILQVKPSIYKSAHLSIYMAKDTWLKQNPRKKRSQGILRDFGGKVFAVMPLNGTVPTDIERRMIAERDLLLKMQPKK